jgi:hypothetical protein
MWRRPRSLLLLISVAAITAACAIAPSPNPTATPTYAVEVAVILDYGIMPYEQIIDASDAIFLAQILSVSSTSWNQDNGRYWDGGLPVYTMELQVLRRIVDRVGLHEHVTVTQVGYSPLEHGSSGIPAAGQRAVFFVVEREIAWREGGLRAVLRTTNTDSDSVIIVGDDRYASTAQPIDEAATLNKIVQDIAERREILPQPQIATPTSASGD